MSMFCFQCEETDNGKGCTVNGVCGKKSDIANLQDDLTSDLIALAVTFKGKNTPQTDKFLIEGLFITVTNVNFDNNFIENFRNKIKKIGILDINRVDMDTLWTSNEDIRSLKSLILFGLRGVAAYAHHASILGKKSEEVNTFFYKGLSAISENLSSDELLSLVMETGSINLKCMELLDSANTSTYGSPSPQLVNCNIEPGPFIVVTGHDLHDLKLLLDQTEGKGINIYTHSEMLPAHGYPELRKYGHLKGNFGSAWHAQQKEFIDIPAPILFTTNCIMPVLKNYSDRIFTTSVVAYPNMCHIDDNKDFSIIIEKALELGGYKELHEMLGINGGGTTMTTGFAHGAILSVVDAIIEAVKQGDIKHFFLVGGCDGRKNERNYYTEFVKQSPQDTIILTLGCAKYRFNDLNIGTIGDFPRIMDMGQCNDAYSAIKVAVALSEAFECTVNELPLTLVLSWYEQKAVCVLLTLLSLGIKNILVGPSLPSFISPNILNVLVEKFNLTPISIPQDDLKKILG